MSHEYLVTNEVGEAQFPGVCSIIAHRNSRGDCQLFGSNIQSFYGHSLSAQHTRFQDLLPINASLVCVCVCVCVSIAPIPDPHLNQLILFAYLQYSARFPCSIAHSGIAPRRQQQHGQPMSTQHLEKRHGTAQRTRVPPRKYSSRARKGEYSGSNSNKVRFCYA